MATLKSVRSQRLALFEPKTDYRRGPERTVAGPYSEPASLSILRDAGG
jgi:hypothetical protein